MAGEIKAKNITDPAVVVTIENLDVPNAEIPEGGTVNLTATNNPIDIQNDPQLKTLIEQDKIILLLEGHELSKGESKLLLEEVLPEMASTSTEQGAIDTGHCFAGKREKYAYFEGAAFSNNSISIANVSWLVSAEGGVKASNGNQEKIGFSDGTNTAQLYLDTSTGTIKSRAAGNFVNQEYKIKIVYITT
jgi:hypothetical protein